MEHYHNRGGMEIATTSGIRLIHDSATGTVTNGPFTYTSIGGTGDSGSADSIISMSFKASQAWSGITSKGRNAANNADIINTVSEGTTAKPPTVAFMWILRFI